MTRAEYLATSTEPGAFRAYYGQFVDDRTISYVARAIGGDVIKASTDPHLNDIPLKQWDRLTASLPVAGSFKDRGDYPTIAGLVCVAKEAARQFAERLEREALQG